jgi:flagellar hook-associated protein 2
MASISSMGIGSGLDVEGIISKLMAVEQVPLTKLDTKEASYQTKISALGSLKSAVSALNSAVASLVPAGNQSAVTKYSSYKASVGNTSAASATASSSAVAGSYSLEVLQLATAHRISTIARAHELTSVSFAGETDPIDQGILDITVNGTTTQITVDDSNDTVGELVTSINNADAGVTAALEDDGLGGKVLVLTSNTGGTAGEMTLSGIAGFTYDPVTQSGDLTQTQAAEGGYTSANAAIAEGTLQITVGDGTPRAITIDSSNNTLAGLRDAINDAGIGVTAALTSVSENDVRLVLTSDTMGSAGKITMSGLAGFAFDGATGTGDLSQASADGGEAAQGSKIKLNGVTVNKDSNTISDIVEGVTLSLTGVTTSATTLTVTQDKSSSLTAALTKIAEAYNELNTAVHDLGDYDEETKTGGILLGNSTLRTVSSSIKNIFQSAVSGTTGSDYKYLSNLGLEFQKDGSLVFNSSKLATATNDDFEAVASMVATFGSQAKTLTDGMLSTEGTITAASDGLQASIDSIDEQRTRLQARLEKIEARYVAQFSALDSLISQMNSTSSYLTQQLANLPSTSKKSS